MPVRSSEIGDAVGRWYAKRSGEACPHCAGPFEPAGDYLVCPMGVVYREHEGRLMVWSLGWVEVDE
ncbi:MAG TPA: hypothetical protein VM487_02695 [Phycisphaerae bacterium]|nr:hypothetical protein [Phycisphaerae bacterium]